MGPRISSRWRKLLGAVAMIAFIILYAPIAMALAESRIVDAPAAIRSLAYVVLGLIWILPLMPLIRWMERVPDERG